MYIYVYIFRLLRFLQFLGKQYFVVSEFYIPEVIFYCHPVLTIKWHHTRSGEKNVNLKLNTYTNKYTNKFSFHFLLSTYLTVLPNHPKGLWNDENGPEYRHVRTGFSVCFLLLF